MKKSLSFILGVLVLSSVIACNSGKKQENTTGSATAEPVSSNEGVLT